MPTNKQYFRMAMVPLLLGGVINLAFAVYFLHFGHSVSGLTSGAVAVLQLWSGFRAQELGAE